MNNKCKNYSKCVEIQVASCLCNIAGRELVGVPDCDNCNMVFDAEESVNQNDK